MPDFILTFLDAYATHAGSVLRQPLDGSQRLFLPFLATSLLVAWIIFKVRQPAMSFREFLFPRHIWTHPQAWLDMRYFVFHSLTGKFLIAGVSLAATLFGINLLADTSAGVPILSADGPFGPVLSWVLILLLYAILLLITDFVSFYLHYLQHKIPLLWQFHKVHHSGEVMHPISNFREHPIDNLLYNVGVAFINGLAIGLALRVVGYAPAPVTILGISVASLLFNNLAYSLRHSHIWLRWPGRWAAVLGSPAHHQIHHSRHPDHLDKNMAFLFPVWDVLFGTYCMPDDNRDVEFGIVEDASELNSCIKMYVVPFRDAWRVLRNGKSDGKGVASCEPHQDAGGAGYRLEENAP